MIKNMVYTQIKNDKVIYSSTERMTLTECREEIKSFQVSGSHCVFVIENVNGSVEEIIDRRNEAIQVVPRGN